MRRFPILLVLPILACSVLNTPLPSTPTPVPVTETAAPATAVPSIPTATLIPNTDTPTAIPNATAFPNPDAYTWKLVTSGLERPVDLQADGSGRLFIIEKTGRIRIVKNGQLLETPFLNIEDRVNDSGNEMGLLGLAFHPDFSQNGFFYVNYTGSGGNTFISRFDASGDSADPDSEKILLTVDQPFSNHNGGVLAFGPDGYLYAGLGDGGSAGDPFGNAQDPSVLLGKILRVDVDNGDPYAIPADNPLGTEVWAVGLRNPWRFSFDKLTGNLYIGDVGQDTWEEIDFLPAGSPGGMNFGWDFREGMHEYSGITSAGLTDPIAEYSHSEGGCSVTGGYVYRGAMNEWNGIYLFGDYCTGFIWGLISSENGWQKQLLFDADVTITSFGQDEVGEIYLTSGNGGIYRLTRK